MGELIYLFEFLDGIVRIDLRCTQVRMSQQFLHTVDVRTVIEHVCGERMPKHVRTALLKRGHFTEPPVHDPVYEFGI